MSWTSRFTPECRGWWLGQRPRKTRARADFQRTFQKKRTPSYAAITPPGTRTGQSHPNSGAHVLLPRPLAGEGGAKRRERASGASADTAFFARDTHPLPSPLPQAGEGARPRCGEAPQTIYFIAARTRPKPISACFHPEIVAGQARPAIIIPSARRCAGALALRRRPGRSC